MLSKLLTSPKLWKVGEHRVKKITVAKKKPYDTIGAYGQITKKTKTVNHDQFKCVDCEKVREERSNFDDTCCYDVIE